MKKKILISLIVILVCILVVGIMYSIDINRMKNNKPVIFSTWGYSYTTPIDLDEDKIKEAIVEYVLNKNETNSSKHNKEKWFIAMDIFLIEEVDDTKTFVYAWVLEESYFEKNSVATQDSGSSIPYKFALKKESKRYIVESHQIPRDGYYAQDIEGIFPSDVKRKIDEVYSDGTIDKLKLDIERQVNKYFNTEELTTDYNSFVGTILEERATYMIVEPNEDEIERKSADKIRINYGTDNVDYLYGVGRKVVISYTGAIMETYPAQINTNEISADGYSDFEIVIKKSDNKEAKKILNNTELYKHNSNYDLYYYGLEQVNVNVDNEILTLEEALKSGKITLEKIISNANRDLDSGKIKGDMYKDGGSMIYKYDTFTIIKLNRTDGNKDMYIGTPEMVQNDII